MTEAERREKENKALEALDKLYDELVEEASADDLEEYLDHWV